MSEEDKTLMREMRDDIRALREALLGDPLAGREGLIDRVRSLERAEASRGKLITFATTIGAAVGGAATFIAQIFGGPK